jgi:predicted PurR-regulated permease PerM
VPPDVARAPLADAPPRESDAATPPLLAAPAERRAAREPREAVGARVFRLVVGVVLGAGALKLGAPVLVPLVGGVFLAVLARPLQRRVARALPHRLRGLGLVVAMAAVLAGVGAFGSALYLSGRAVAHEFRDRRPRLEAAVAALRARVTRAGVPAAAVPSLPGTSPAAPAGGAGTAGGKGAGGAASGAESASPPPGTGSALRAAAGTVEALGNLLLALAFCALGLAEAGAARRRLVRAVPDRATPAVMRAVDDTVAAFRRYAVVKTLTSALTGSVTFLAALALGLPLAWVWGFLTFLLEYIPSVGSVLSVIPPTVMAVAAGGPAKGVLTFFVIGTLQLILGNVVDPRLEGRFMAVSPFVVLLSILVWGWLWGPVGALLAVPMTVAAVTACRYTPGAGGVATLLTEAPESGDGDGPGAGPPA